MRVFSSLTLLVGLSALADAYNCPGKECKRSASPYCSSYMKVPKKTTTVYKAKTVTSTCYSTKTPGTTTVTANPTTLTSTSTVTPRVTTTTTISTSTTITETVAPICTAPPFLTDLPDPELPVELPSLARRNNPPSYGVAKPKCFRDYNNNKAISSACKCVNVKPTTSTVTKHNKTTTKKVTSTKRASSTQTVTVTPTVTQTTTITVAPTTVTETTTTFTSTSTSTVTTGRPALPTDAFNIVLGNPLQATPPTVDNIGAIQGLRALVSTTLNVNPVNFIAPGRLLPTTFSLDGATGELLAEGQELPAFLSNGLGENPQQVSYAGLIPDPIFPTGASLISCELVANDDNTCELLCAGFPGTAPGGSASPTKRQLPDLPIPDIPIPGDGDEEAPSILAMPYVCGLDNTFFLGDGEDFQNDDANCIEITAFVVPIEPLLPGLPDLPVPLADQGR
ncbi:hypothetical protein CERZMDRAFT_106717 [Cercospora zeae-maydis SCOH1-5]|uniref:Uncharacterized protein n=1 Tax=Cercospora zeae-maydis SCOH1-5 TaxID=717836 RepID=A0A6A6FAX2_9PEZI|nr:hypothetical protein CERZMDRAFT_106717 [Cercospora zeae-maydis SCOH1-5]